MNVNEGTVVLELLAAIGEDRAFLDAVDADDLDEVRRLMRRAGVPGHVAAQVVQAIVDGDELG